MTFLASIPSPPVNEFFIGPLRVTFYGILVTLGVVIAWTVTKRRFLARGGSVADVEKIMLRVVLFGFLGARLAYVSTNLFRFEGEWWRIIAIWEGGIALYGGLTGGALAIWWTCRRLGVPITMFLDSLAPGLPMAQAVGRWGNYFNQELFGTPSNLPWAVEIAPQFRPQQYAQFETFHPTFLYESLWNLALAGTIVWLERRYPSLRGRLIGIYFIGYGLMRFLLELMRTDTTFRFLGLSRNGWVSIGVILIGFAVLYWRRDREPTSQTPATA
ncbi:MAG: prolipoprotein diacylglyceryl transferase [Actinobacteria bacterium]|nr:prolipoprotein diacylglyceryl transferase [Actinomycetota bacterium]MCI0677767.1 prolipoprotein diacylglyceryl transferase [Actinomycetota bacterium]